MAFTSWSSAGAANGLSGRLSGSRDRRGHREGGIDLGGQVLSDRAARPCGRVAEMELHRLAVELLPMLGPVVDGGADAGQCGTVVGFELVERRRPALLHGAHHRRMAKPGEQAVAGVLAKKVDVVRSVHLVADDG